ncbi:HIR complex subunit [Cladophialophora chaetospira]|uniref:HIR complex subunit n=1 Tax=Cladophialophora chaetospira TaxID=386627 RepID=A0AA38XCZ2_9EURO|nr:HIR complex subunit [Cladophialophora chaetospira]
MLEAIVQPSLEVTIVESPIPTPAEGEILIKVVYSGVNPKDWKSVVYSGQSLNSGDDIAGIVEAVGGKVAGFRKGDRVAAFHQMRAPHGSFAEYAIAPTHTTFHLPDHTSFEELPPPWEPATTPVPLIVYGASGAVGAFVVKLACRSNIHPIIAVAGNGRPMVEKLLDASRGDVVIDYRRGPDHVISTVQQLLKDQRLESILHAFDTISEKGAAELVAQLLAPDGHATFVLPEKDYSAVAETILTSLTYVGYVHTGPFPADPNKGIKFNPAGHGADFSAVYSSLFTRGLQDGWLTGHPFEVVSGLGGLPTALRNLKAGTVSAKKYVIRISDN